MQTAHIMLALGGDKGNTVPKFNVTAAEIAVLRAIHGEDSVQDIDPAGEVSRSNREELSRLNEVYGRAKIQTDTGSVSVVQTLFPGAAARVFATLDELAIPEDFYKAQVRAKPAPAPDPAPEEDEQDDFDGKTKAELIAFAEQAGIEIDPSSKKADILAAIQAAQDEGDPAPAQNEDASDGVSDMDDEIFS